MLSHFIWQNAARLICPKISQLLCGDQHMLAVQCKSALSSIVAAERLAKWRDQCPVFQALLARYSTYSCPTSGGRAQIPPAMQSRRNTEVGTFSMMVLREKQKSKQVMKYGDCISIPAGTSMLATAPAAWYISSDWHTKAGRQPGTCTLAGTESLSTSARKPLSMKRRSRWKQCQSCL